MNRCTVLTKKGLRCRNRIGAKSYFEHFCWVHALGDKGLRVKISPIRNAGLGVFSAFRIPAGTVLDEVWVKGPLISGEAAEAQPVNYYLMRVRVQDKVIQTVLDPTREIVPGDRRPVRPHHGIGNYVNDNRGTDLLANVAIHQADLEDATLKNVGDIVKLRFEAVRELNADGLTEAEYNKWPPRQPTSDQVARMERTKRRIALLRRKDVHMPDEERQMELLFEYGEEYWQQPAQPLPEPLVETFEEAAAMIEQIEHNENVIAAERLGLQAQEDLATVSPLENLVIPISDPQTMQAILTLKRELTSEELLTMRESVMQDADSRQNECLRLMFLVWLTELVNFSPGVLGAFTHYTQLLGSAFNAGFRATWLVLPITPWTDVLNGAIFVLLASHDAAAAVNAPRSEADVLQLLTSLRRAFNLTKIESLIKPNRAALVCALLCWLVKRDFPFLEYDKSPFDPSETPYTVSLLTTEPRRNLYHNFAVGLQTMAAAAIHHLPPADFINIWFLVYDSMRWAGIDVLPLQCAPLLEADLLDYWAFVHQSLQAIRPGTSTVLTDMWTLTECLIDRAWPPNVNRPQWRFATSVFSLIPYIQTIEYMETGHQFLQTGELEHPLDHLRYLFCLMSSWVRLQES